MTDDGDVNRKEVSSNLHRATLYKKDSERREIRRMRVTGGMLIRKAILRVRCRIQYYSVLAAEQPQGVWVLIVDQLVSQTEEGR